MLVAAAESTRAHVPPHAPRMHQGTPCIYAATSRFDIYLNLTLS